MTKLNIYHDKTDMKQLKVICTVNPTYYKSAPLPQKKPVTISGANVLTEKNSNVGLLPFKCYATCLVRIIDTPPYPLVMLLTLCYATLLVRITDTPYPLVMLLTLCYATLLVRIIDTPLPHRNATNIVLRNTSC